MLAEHKEGHGLDQPFPPPFIVGHFISFFLLVCLSLHHKGDTLEPFSYPCFFLLSIFFLCDVLFVTRSMQLIWCCFLGLRLIPLKFKHVLAFVRWVRFHVWSKTTFPLSAVPSPFNASHHCYLIVKKKTVYFNVLVTIWCIRLKLMCKKLW